MSVSPGAVITRDALSDFAGELFSSMPRVDQRRWAEVYLRGLLLVEGKKSVRRISEDILSLPVHQSLQQFINQSPWGWDPVRADLVRYIENTQRPQAWVISRAAIPKRGDHSVGVERRFLHEAGRVVNCQIGLMVSLAVPSANLPVNWRLLLSDRWLVQESLRESAYIPDGVRANPEWVDFIEMLDELGSWKAGPAPVVGDLRQLAGADRLVAEMAQRELDFAVEVDGSLRLPDGSSQLQDLRSSHPARNALRCAGSALEFLGGRRWHGSASDDAKQQVKIVSSIVRLSSGHGAARRIRLLSELSPTGAPVRFWLTNLMDHRVDEVLALSRLAVRSKASAQALEEQFGLRDFEGRSFRGWHHHTTMVSAAHAFDQLG
ncbi:transposase [Streptomyces sp. H27-C3]|uniref:IS701 family transposase n=1 Tax=Streptomyces sp. H27-C3 TaxID=3046305 RepID=UPI0024BA3BF8|nr:transposase [Streptomyces sp. H27-C3]MDJ0466752.1 transposase [Streptomyces sp. H27-C3]